jgi:hypothetical protein
MVHFDYYFDAIANHKTAEVTSVGYKEKDCTTGCFFLDVVYTGM